MQPAPADHQSNESSSTESTNEVVQETSTFSSSTRQNSIITQVFMGRELTTNTKRASKTALKAMCTYVILEKNKGRREENKVRFDYWAEAGRKFIFPYRDKYLNVCFDEWTVSQLSHVRFFLIEFVVQYKCRESGKSIIPSTMKT